MNIRKMMAMGMFGQSKATKMNNFIRACNDCSKACELVIHFSENNQGKLTDELLNLLFDCFTFTQVIEDFCKRKSVFQKPVCDIGKQIFERCKLECEKYPEILELKEVTQKCHQCITLANSGI